MNSKKSLKWRTLPPIIIMLAMIPVATMPAHAAKHKKEEVKLLIAETQKRLESYRSGENARDIAPDISKLEEYIARSSALLNKKKIDNAFYEISIGILYFLVIDARIDLARALRELAEVKSQDMR